VVLVDPTDVDAIAGALRQLAGSEELRQKLGDRGKKRAAAFPWEAAVSKTWAGYCELLR
jgi:glycosyltransferase involved in cell wall biosynthesis